MAKDWEDAPSAGDGWEDAPDEMLNKQVTGLGQKLVGGLEGAANFVSGALIGGPAMGLRTIGEWAATGDLNTALKRAQSSQEAATYEPRTQAGKKASQVISGELENWMTSVGDAFSGSQALINKDKMDQGTLTGADLRGEAMERSVGEAIGNVFMPGVPLGALGRKAPAMPKSKADALIQNRELHADRPTQQGPAWMQDPKPVDPTRQKLNEMQTQEIIDRLTEIDRQLSMEESPGPLEQNPYWQALKADQDAALQERLNNINRHEPDSGGVGQETLYVDPQGQTFRGKPYTPDPREALERQGEAFDNAATYNQWGEKGDPLPLLQRDQLRSSNEGPMGLPEEVVQAGLKSELVKREVENHPLVKKAQERVQKQEELIFKVNELMAEGRATRNQLKRAEQDLDNFKESLERTIENVSQATKDGKRAIPFNFKRQGGAINPEVFKEGFQKLKQLADGTWLRAHSDGQSLTIEAVKDSHKIGGALFEKTDKWSEPSKTDMAATMVGSKQKGMATEIYKFASELGNDIVPSKIRTKEGSAMWERFNQKGLAENNVIRSPGNKQRGAINIQDIINGVKRLDKGTRIETKDGRVGKVVDDRFISYRNPDTVNRLLREEIDKLYVQFGSDKWWGEEARTARDEAIAKVHDMVDKLDDKHGMFMPKVDFGDGRPVSVSPTDIEKAYTGLRSVKSPSNRETGAIFTDPQRAKKLETVEAAEKILGPIRPSQLTPEQTIELAKDAPDIKQNLLQKSTNYLTKGGLYFADRTKNVLVRYGVEQVMDADRKSRAAIQEFIHDPKTGLGAVFRAMSDAEQRDVWKIIDHADKTQQPFTRAEMQSAGFSEAQIHAVEVHRQVMDKAFEAMNKVRERTGQKPVDKRTAYAAMNASGDYRMVVKKDGEIVGMIGRNDKWSANVLAERLKAQGYEIGEQHYVGGIPRERGNAQTAMLQALDFLAKDDPKLRELLLKADEVMRSEAYNFLNMPIHTKQKKGIWGMQGRKNDLVVNIRKQQRLDDLNAKEGLQAQMAYAEMALKWEHMVDAASNIREVLNSEPLKGKQPIAKQWVNDYLQNALGYNPEAIGRGLENAMSAAFDAAGIGWSNGRTIMAGARKITNTMLLGLNPYFWGANVVQPLVSMPGMKASLVAKGLDPAFDFGTGYLYLAKGAVTDMKRQMGTKLSAFENQMEAYAKNKHVYGSDLVEHSNRVRKDAIYRFEQVGNFVAGGIESWSRRTVFYTFAHMLKENGMKVEHGLFEAAHNLTDMTMNNYSAVERPRIYNAAGPVGDLAANLTSFKHNELSRYAMFARQIGDDKSARPLLAQLAANIAFAGVMGTIFFEEADQLYKYITTKMGKPDSLSLRVMKMSEDASKALGIKNKHALSHGGLSWLGVDVTKRLGLSDVVPDNIIEASFPGGSKLGAMAGTAIDAARHQDEWHTKKMVREWSPGAITGAQDLSWFSKGDMALNRNSGEAQYKRDFQDKLIKASGGTSVKESVYKQKHYENQWIRESYEKLRNGPLQRMHGELITKGTISKENVQEYLKYEGDVSTLSADISRMNRNMRITEKDRDLLRSAASKSITSLRHAQRLQESYKE